ncbi:hypothetical protein LY76DRAFT_205337 [Colletotrichum caudatum]|nr:hypothetical protein LY76DRAFT_205337 [Colletotrichum caudatum]
MFTLGAFHRRSLGAEVKAGVIADGFPWPIRTRRTKVGTDWSVPNGATALQAEAHLPFLATAIAIVRNETSSSSPWLLHPEIEPHTPPPVIRNGSISRHFVLLQPKSDTITGVSASRLYSLREVPDYSKACKASKNKLTAAYPVSHCLQSRFPT